MTTTTRDDVKQLAATIESLAKKVQLQLDTDGDLTLDAATELVRNSTTFVFALGEVHAMEQVEKANRNTKTNNLNYHDVRDTHGRFAKNYK